MAEIHIHFISPWGLFLDVSTVNADVYDIIEAKDYVDTNYCPIFEKKLKSMGVNKKESVWDNSIIFMNGSKIGSLENKVFKKGDKIELIPLISGG